MKRILKLLAKKDKGFTLIELIVVIAILAILAAIIIPNVTGYINDANESTARANAQTVYTAAQAEYVSAAADGDSYDAGTYASGDDLFDAIGDYVGDNFDLSGYSVVIGDSGVSYVTNEYNDDGDTVTYPESE